MENKKKLTINKLMQILVNSSYLDNLLEFHKQDYDEVLLHVLFGDITRYFIEEIEGLNIMKKESNKLNQISSLIEKMLVDGDKEVSNIATVSFIENLLKTNTNNLNKAVHELKPLSRNLLEELRNIN